MKKLIKISTCHDISDSSKHIRVIGVDRKRDTYFHTASFAAPSSCLGTCDNDFIKMVEWNKHDLYDRLEIYWLSCWNGKVDGVKDDLYIPKNRFYEVCQQEDGVILADTERPVAWPKIVYKGSKTLHNVCGTKVYRKKLSQFLATHFQWPGSKEIRLYDDGEYSFYFEEINADGSRGICGGVILHKNKNKNTSYYGMHT